MLISQKELVKKLTIATSESIDILNNILEQLDKLVKWYQLEQEINKGEPLTKQPECWQPTTSASEDPEVKTFIDQLLDKMNNLSQEDKALLRVVITNVILGTTAVAAVATGACAYAPAALLLPLVPLVVDAILKYNEEEIFKQSLPGATSYGNSEEEREAYKNKVMRHLRERKRNDNKKEATCFEDYVAEKIIDELEAEYVFTSRGAANME